jgi:hypothetical protein
MLSPREIDMLRQIISLAGALISSAHPEAGRSGKKKAVDEGRPLQEKRRRRTGKELSDFRKMLISERKRGVPVADLARKHGISAAYIYQL